MDDDGVLPTAAAPSRHPGLWATLVVLVGAGLFAMAVGREGSGPPERSPSQVAPGSDAPEPAASPREEPHLSSSDHGFSPGYSVLWDDDDDLRRDLDGMAAAGGGWVRVDFDWASVEREEGEFDWRPLDRVVAAVHERGMRVLALPTYTPAWARPPGTTDKHPPVDPADFARFVDAAVERYAPQGVSHWEIWNEANYTTFWQPRPDPTAYGRLLRLASATIRAGDPEAVVLTSGTGPAVDAADGSTVAPRTFLATLYQDGLAGSFDAVAHHPYTYPERPLADLPDKAFLDATRQLRALMVENGDGDKEIWGTEFGAPVGTVGAAVSLEDQASHLVEAYDAWLSWPFTGPLLWYNWRDTGTDGDETEQNFGLVRSDGEPKPALEAFRQHALGWCDQYRVRCRS